MNSTLKPPLLRSRKEEEWDNKSQRSRKGSADQARNVVEICELLKYRFIFGGVPIEEIRGHFDYKGEFDDDSDEEEAQWRREYISMAEVKNILRSPTFGLNETDSFILARYLVEDSPNDYVYSDPCNEHLRSVVKSIIRNSVGEFNLPANASRVK
ncbi:unnamed protein product [Sphagnum balticum]